jgi:propanediol dehydratase small subunit
MKGLNVKRASLMSNNKNTKKSPRLQVGSEADSTDGFTKRLLLSMVVDMTEMRKTAERLQVQVFTLAKAHGIAPPDMSEED